MIFENLIDFKKNLHKNKRLLGLDVGTKTIGVALSDRDKNIATPKFIVKRKSNEKEGINFVVICQHGGRDSS